MVHALHVPVAISSCGGLGCYRAHLAVAESPGSSASLYITEMTGAGAFRVRLAGHGAARHAVLRSKPRDRYPLLPLKP